MGHRHGFECPMGPHQIVALALYLYLLLSYYTLTAPFLPSTASHIALQVVYGVAAAATLAFGVTATWLDPSDPSLKNAAAAAVPTGYKCSICQVYVRPRSKHCRVCDRCTEDFDHHCMWLNNCVGRVNYPFFFALLCSTLLLCSAQFGLSLYLFIQSFIHHSLIQPLQQKRYGGHVSMNGLRVVWPLSAVLTAILAGLLADLLTFHLVLRWKGMTTYDYILAQREAQEHSAAAAQHLQQYRCACLHKKKARITPEATLDDIDTQLSSNISKKKFKVKLNPIMAWRVKSSTSNPRPAHARARMSSMAQYIMPALFTSKSAEAKAQLSQATPVMPAEAGEQVSTMHNPMFDIEAHADAYIDSAEPSSTRLPVLLTPSVGPSIAWSPLEATAPENESQVEIYAGVAADASRPDAVMNISQGLQQLHSPTDNVASSESLLHN